MTYFVYVNLHGKLWPQKWYDDRRKGNGTFQRGETGSGDLMAFHTLKDYEERLSLDQLTRIYPPPPPKEEEGTKSP